MIDEGKDAWTIFFFGKRSKTWGIIGLDGQYKPMSEQIEDRDGGWWHHVVKGLSLHMRTKNIGNVVATVDSVIIAENKVLLIKRGKEPFKDVWAFPGGRIEQTDTDIEVAARRELYEETGLKDIDLRYHSIVGDLKRDPRGFCISIVHVANLDKIPEGLRAGDDAIDYDWFNIDNLPSMAFDHSDILQKIISERLTKL
jgi:8-oxo-dGTP diphosphatase